MNKKIKIFCLALTIIFLLLSIFIIYKVNSDTGFTVVTLANKSYEEVKELDWATLSNMQSAGYNKNDEPDNEVCIHAGSADQNGSQDALRLIGILDIKTDGSATYQQGENSITEISSNEKMKKLAQFATFIYDNKSNKWRDRYSTAVSTLYYKGYLNDINSFLVDGDLVVDWDYSKHTWHGYNYIEVLDAINVEPDPIVNCTYHNTCVSWTYIDEEGIKHEGISTEDKNKDVEEHPEHADRYTPVGGSWTYPKSGYYSDYRGTYVDKTCSARILIYSGHGGCQSRFFFWGAEGEEEDIEINKYITNVESNDGSEFNIISGLESSRENMTEKEKNEKPVVVNSQGDIKVDYTITLTNNGKEKVTGKLEDAFDTEFFTGTIEGPNKDDIGKDIELAPGETKTFKITLIGKSSTTYGGKYRNTATFEDEKSHDYVNVKTPIELKKFIGDSSISRTPNGEKVFWIGDSWIKYIENLIGDPAYSKAKSGTKPQWLLDEFDTLAIPDDVGSIIVHFGLNYYHSEWTDGTMSELLNKLQSSYPDKTIYVLKISNVSKNYTGGYETKNQYINSFNSYLRGLCSGNIKLVDVTDQINQNGFLMEQYDDGSGYHLNSEGCNLWYNSILNAIGYSDDNSSEPNDDSQGNENSDSREFWTEDQKKEEPFDLKTDDEDREITYTIKLTNDNSSSINGEFKDKPEAPIEITGVEITDFATEDTNEETNVLKLNGSDVSSFPAQMQYSSTESVNTLTIPKKSTLLITVKAKFPKGGTTTPGEEEDKWKNESTFTPENEEPINSWEWVKIEGNVEVKLNKYIESIVNGNMSGEDRSIMDEGTKAGSPADAGDSTTDKTITYKVTLKNEDENKEVTGVFIDTPDSLISIQSISTSSGSEITLGPGDEFTITITARFPSGIGGTYKNTARFIITKVGDKENPKVRQPDPSSDYFKVENPPSQPPEDTKIEKWISNVTSAPSGSFVGDRKEKDKNWKETRPAEVIQGSQIEYTVKLKIENISSLWWENFVEYHCMNSNVINDYQNHMDNCYKIHLIRLYCTDEYMTEGLAYNGQISATTNIGTIKENPSYGGNGSDIKIGIDLGEECPSGDLEVEIKLGFNVIASNMRIPNLENKIYNARYECIQNQCLINHANWKEQTYTYYYFWSGIWETYTVPICLHDNCSYFDGQVIIRSGNIEGEDYDYVRVLDPEVKGVVFLDKNNNNVKDGTNENISGMARDQYKHIKVELWKVEDGQEQLMVTKEVDTSTGEFNFGRVRKGKNIGQGSPQTPPYYDIKPGMQYYYADSSLLRYYIIFNYDGERFEPVDAALNGILNDSNANNITPTNLDGTHNMINNFENDSDAKEYDETSSKYNGRFKRDDFNSRLETIANDKAFQGTTGSSPQKPMDYEEEGQRLQKSYAKWDYNNYDSCVLNEKSRSFTFFYPEMQGDSVEYLKHINLGLKVRPEADLSLEKDVVRAEVAVNGFKMTYDYNQLGKNGFTKASDNTLQPPYVLRIYREDYEYRTSNQDVNVQNILKANNPYKSGDWLDDNDLQIVITYKITIKNKSDNGITSKIREVVDYYSEELEVINTSAKLGTESGAQLTVSNGSSFGNPSTGHCNFITGMENQELQKDGELVIYIKYRVVKPGGAIQVDNEGDSLINGKYNCAEVGAYSFYKNGKPAGLVDKNSNPGNANVNNTERFEDDTFMTGLLVVLRDGGNPPGGGDPPGSDPKSGREVYRIITGNVFEEIDKQKNSSSDGELVGDGIKNGNDKWAENVIAKLYEYVSDGNQDYLVDTGLWDRTGSDGKYYLGGRGLSDGPDGATILHAGTYVVRFIYGDEYDKLVTTDGTTIRYSGQDFKSTKYTDVKVGSEENGVVDDVSDFSETANGRVLSFAKDNEVRRLEVNEYSTTTTYPMDTVLKSGQNSSELQILAKNTAMFADTRAFNVDIEYDENCEGVTKSRRVKQSIREDGIYTIEELQYVIEHIDFGLIERPLTKLQLLNDISEIKAITSDGNTLIDLVFDIYYKKNGNEIEHYSAPNYEKSTGSGQVQLLNRFNGNQGFRYANVDNDILQGMTVIVKYQIGIINNSETDHLSAWLENKIVDSPSIDLSVSYGSDPSRVTPGDRSGNTIIDYIDGQTRTYNYESNYLYKLLYSGGAEIDGSILTGKLSDSGNGKSVIYNSGLSSSGYNQSDSVKKAYTYLNIHNVQGDYRVGYYLGNIYYNNVTSGREAVVKTRVDQYIDYVDTDLVFKPEENTNENGQITYLTYTLDEIASRGLLKDITTTTPTKISDGNKYFIDKENDKVNNNLAFNIEDSSINRNFYKFLEPTENGTKNISNKVNDFIIDSEHPDATEITNIIENPEESMYIISLQASRTLTSETDAEGLEIENLAEIVKVANTAGRKVYVKAGNTGTQSFIGNTTNPNPDEPSTPPDEVDVPMTPLTIVQISEPETDTDFTEVITFSPPTGLTQLQITHNNEVNRQINTLLIVIPSLIIVAGVIYVIIQFARRKKFYK